MHALPPGDLPTDSVDAAQRDGAHLIKRRRTDWHGGPSGSHAGGDAVGPPRARLPAHHAGESHRHGLLLGQGFPHRLDGGREPDLSIEPHGGGRHQDEPGADARGSSEDLRRRHGVAAADRLRDSHYSNSAVNVTVASLGVEPIDRSLMVDPVNNNDALALLARDPLRGECDGDVPVSGRAPRPADAAAESHAADCTLVPVAGPHHGRADIRPGATLDGDARCWRLATPPTVPGQSATSYGGSSGSGSGPGLATWRTAEGPAPKRQRAQGIADRSAADVGHDAIYDQVHDGIGYVPHWMRPP